MHPLLNLIVLACPMNLQDKAPEPAAKDQEDARKRVREIFKDDYAKKAPADARAFAQKLLKQGQENKGDLPLTFVLLREARDKAVEALDATLALEAVDLAAETFSISTVAQKGDVLDRVQRRTAGAEALDALLGAYLQVIAEAVSADDYEDALKLFPGAEAVAARLDPLSVVEIRAKKREVDALGREYKAIKKHVDTLKAKPEDPEANLAVGKFLCFVREDFKAGIPHLAKGSDLILRGLAEGELGQLSGAVSHADIADRWYDLAKRYDSGKFEKRFLDRAFYWYDRAWPTIMGLARVEFEKRLNEREERYGKVNLLRLIDPETDSRPLRENPKAPYVWDLKDGVLFAPSLAGMAVLEIPYQMPVDYDLEITLEFVGNRGSDLFYVFPPSAEGRCVGFQGGWERGTHRVADTSRALEIPGGEKGRLTSRVPLFKDRAVAKVIFSCRGGTLTVTAGNRTILVAPGKFSAPKGKPTLALGCYSAQYKIHLLKVSPAGKRLR